jgi:hypothetical protein
MQNHRRWESRKVWAPSVEEADRIRCMAATVIGTRTTPMPASHWEDRIRLAGWHSLPDTVRIFLSSTCALHQECKSALGTRSLWRLPKPTGMPSLLST